MLEHCRAGWKRFIRPLAQWCVNHHIGANAITVTGTVLTMVAMALAVYTNQLFVGAVVLTLLVLCDSLDGSVAALQGGGTPFGAFLDSTLDRIADWALHAGLLWYVLVHGMSGNDVMGMDGWALLGVIAIVVSMMASFVTSYARARCEGLGRRNSVGIATRADRLAFILVAMALVGLGLPLAVLSCLMTVLAVMGVITVVQRIVHAWKVLH